MDSSLVLASIIILYYMCLNVATIDSLRTGAPFIACGSLTPIHGLYQAKSSSLSQFYITQSSSEYGSKTNITVTIGSRSESQYFRGFMIQAYDPMTNQRIGHFSHTTDSRPMHSCSVATHRNSEKKSKLQLTWTSVSEESHRHSVRPILNIGHLGPLLVARERVTDSSSINRSNSASKRVKFRGTFVVSFSDFYTGFQSDSEIDQVPAAVVPPIVVPAGPTTDTKKTPDYNAIATQQESPPPAIDGNQVIQQQQQEKQRLKQQLQQQQQQQVQAVGVVPQQIASASNYLEAQPAAAAPAAISKTVEQVQQVATN